MVNSKATKLNRLNIDSWPDHLIWLTVFFITILIILTVQLVLLPYVFPSWHAGNGLLIGGDWLAFHSIAVEAAEEIRSDDWSAWKLRPGGCFPAGVASAVYALTTSAPWTLAPLNAAVHASTYSLVVKLLLLFVNSRKLALISAVPFTFFPSAMLWYTQIHRDGYNILGMLMFVYGMLLIVGYEEKSRREGWGAISALSGIVIIWFVRPYILDVYFFVGIILLLMAAVYLTFVALKNQVQWKTVLTKLVLFATILAAISMLSEADGSDKYRSEQLERSYYCGDAIMFFKSVDFTLPEEQYPDNYYHWENEDWIPDSIENQLYSVAVLRSQAYPERFGETTGSIDYDISLHSVNDYFRYLPRALQIAFIAPFPEHWFGEGGTEATTFFRRVSAFEMIIIYLMLLSLFYGLWLWRQKIEIYMIIVFSIVMMMPIVYGVPNIGTVYRYRYGYLMILVVLGAAALLRFVLKMYGHDGDKESSLLKRIRQLMIETSCK